MPFSGRINSGSICHPSLPSGGTLARTQLVTGRAALLRGGPQHAELGSFLSVFNHALNRAVSFPKSTLFRGC